MNKQEILAKLQDIFRKVMKNENLVLSNDMTTEDIQEWNSLANQELIMTIESEFHIKFNLMEMLDLDSVGNILSAIENKLS